MTETARAVAALLAPARRRARLAVALGGLGAAATALGLAAWVAPTGVLGGAAWVFVAYVLAAGAAGALVAWGRTAVGALRVERAMPHVEAAAGFRRGALAGLLAPQTAGTSAELFAHADAAGAERLSAAGSAALGPLRGRVARLWRVAAAVAGVGALLLGSAGPVRGSAADLWRPGDMWALVTAPVRLEASASAVARGEPVRLVVRAAGQRTARLRVRAPGEPWREQEVALGLDGVGAAVIDRLGADLYAVATAGGRSSDTVHVVVRLPVFVAGLAVTARYPAYLGLEDEPLPTTGDTLVLPAGTRLETEGGASGPLARVAWEGPGGALPLAVRGDRFAGVVTPGASGTYRLVLEPAGDVALGGEPVVLPVRLEPDAPPTIAIAAPAADTALPATRRVALVLEAQDDHGLSAVTVEVRTSREAATVERVPLPPGGADRVVLPVGLDFTGRTLAPGDSVRVVATATDTRPGGQVGRSRELVLHLPTATELRAEERAATQAAGSRLDSLLQAARRLERRTEEVARERPRSPGTGRAPSPEQLSFDQAQKAEAVAAEQQRLSEAAAAMQQQLEALREAADAAGLGDSAFRAQLDEVREQLARALSPELREKLRQLDQALRDLDAERTREALEALREQQQQLREALERSKELFRRAALEGELQNLGREAAALAREQQQWSEQVASADSARAAAAEERLARQADSLAAALDNVGQQLRPEGRQAPMQQMAEQARRAAQQMKQAAAAARQGQRQQARQKGEQAAETLQPLEEQLGEEREELQEQWREEVADVLDRALAETSRLAERQLGVEQALRRGLADARTRGDLGAVEEGTDRLTEQLKQLSGRNALVSPRIAATLGAARLQQRRARDVISTATPNPREAADRTGEALDGLNLAAFLMLRARERVSGAASGSGLAEAMEQMQQLAQQQGQLGQQAGGMLPQMGPGQAPGGLSALAQQQRRLAEQLEQLRGQGDMPGAGEFAAEAAELARRLEAQRLDRETVERQERLFRRMLDAGRTLQGREEDDRKERESQAGRDDDARVPAALRRLRESDRPRLPTWDELQALSPADRRLVLEYFRRLGGP